MGGTRLNVTVQSKKEPVRQLKQKVNLVSVEMWGHRSERQFQSGELMASKSFHGSCDPNVRKLLLQPWSGTVTATVSPTKIEQRHYNGDYRHHSMLGTSCRPPEDRLRLNYTPPSS